MTAKQFVGWAMIASVFLTIFILYAVTAGLVQAAVAFAIGGALSAVIVAAVKLTVA